ncbi:P-loop containing nucleoside triphosphate hydrolase protein [Epithele typhae]|uniref:P-loop containing nucleoside triphosphate hydrolase protein n=1 Tax=Epithele typhae TaxID=378194 RepID=UPI0020079DBA|nr:P-loop containing nucleoside triphosphate hydrolase protein [Epithele typhae]KAH9912144.1 P-loop containing nucleoside triphosphate hydrolase protein [Epithele typhae]
MPRRIPISGKRRQERNELKRAVKRGELDARPKGKRKGLHARTSETAAAEAAAAIASSTRLKLPQSFLDKTRALASSIPLTRPLPAERAILPDPAPPALGSTLRCPMRPQWDYNTSKEELEANEEVLFEAWLAETDALLNDWTNPSQVDAQAAQMPHAPPSFERNLQVWRQLWRVTEISHIILILLDARCPTLHFPPALADYLSNMPNADSVRIVLVLTKVDIAGPERAVAWHHHLRARHPGMRVVQVESYAEQPHAGGASTGARKPHLPSAFRRTLVDAVRDAHAELLESPEASKSTVERPRPRMRSQVDWENVLAAHGSQVGAVFDDSAASKPQEPTSEDSGGNSEASEPEYLSIGLIGQPNVGKSSLLNALFGTQKASASRTPGKTKHFQTLFWTPEVRVVDCPGIVFPNHTPMEDQVLSGVLPITRVSAVPLCVHRAAQLLPLERVLDLTHPSITHPPPVSKRAKDPAWTASSDPFWDALDPCTDPFKDLLPPPTAPLVWTAMDVLSAHAELKGYATAQVGRPDVNRAGNAGEHREPVRRVRCETDLPLRSSPRARGEPHPVGVLAARSRRRRAGRRRLDRRRPRPSRLRRA